MSNGAVLVVEDEQLILLDVESALEEAGFEVVAAHNAAEAMAAFDAEPVKIQGPRHGHKPGQIRLASRSASAPGEPNHTRDLIYMSVGTVQSTGAPRVFRKAS